MTHCHACKIRVPVDALTCPSCGAALTETSGPTAVLPAKPAAQSPQPSAQSTTGARFATGAMLTERYRIVSLLGRGGMGEVYKAEDLKLNQVVALKFLPESIAFDGAALARFHNEVRITRQISHPNVCRVYDIGEANGLHFLSMEFIDGEDLASLLRRIGRLPGDKAIEIARQICAGLAAAHDNGVLHRDLKPANVMIDGRGKARITDFGVAIAAAEIRPDDIIVGTPRYMAPEQLTGKEITQRSDIFALGLVLYELFTGKQAFQTDDLREMLRLHEQSTPTTPSSHVKNIDPLVEKVILRCLEKDPDQRPSSAIQVAAALPGGDPLAAALAAGEMPSPEMVAAAHPKSSLKPLVAAACFAAILIGCALIVILSQRTKLLNYVPLQKSPDVLADRAREVVQKLGYTEPPADSVYSFSFNNDATERIKQYDQSRNRWQALRQGEPAALWFWFRQSPGYLLPLGHYVYLGNPVSDPPAIYTGMIDLVIDSQGRLAYFEAVPPQVEAPGPITPPDWPILFQEARLDPAKFKSIEPRWTPAHHSDTRAAWEELSPHGPQGPRRIEAAGYRGRVVYFECVQPSDGPSRQVTNTAPAAGRTVQLLVFGIMFSIFAGACLLAWYNVRRGRGDRKGAFRLAAFVFLINTVRTVVWTHHVPSLNGELGLMLKHMPLTLATAAVVWVLYIALEPFVRARWPHRIISWSRLLAGDWRNSLVGRDVLTGVLVGILLTLVYNLHNLLPGWLGWPPETPISMATGWALNGVNGIVERLLVGFNFALWPAMGFFFLFLLLFIVLRRDWLASLAGGGLLTVLYSFDGIYPSINWPFAALTAALITIILMRFGLLPMVAAFLVSYWTYELPITTNLSAWYGVGTILVLVIVTGLAATSFYLALGGQKLFAGKLLHD